MRINFYFDDTAGLWYATCWFGDYACTAGYTNKAVAALKSVYRTVRFRFTHESYFDTLKHTSGRRR